MAATYNRLSNVLLIDNELLIEEVRKRPAIYDRNLKEYNDHVYKKRLWEQICEILYQDSWHSRDEVQKERSVTEVLKRWNNLRTCFSRELKKTQNGENSSKRRKYLYHDRLLFLLDGNSSTLYSEQGSNIDPEESQDQRKEELIPKKRKTKERQEKKLDKCVEYINQLRQELNFVKVDSVDSLKSLETCPDTNFALSLVPLLKMVAIDKKVDAQIEILSILKKYAKKDMLDVSFMKFEAEDDDNMENGESDDSEMMYNED